MPPGVARSTRKMRPCGGQRLLPFSPTKATASVPGPSSPFHSIRKFLRPPWCRGPLSRRLRTYISCRACSRSFTSCFKNGSARKLLLLLHRLSAAGYGPVAASRHDDLRIALRAQVSLPNLICHFPFVLLVLCVQSIFSDQACPYCSRSFFLRTLPMGFLGNSSINSTPLGLLKLAIRSRQNSITSSGVAVCPSFNTT